MTNTHNDMKQLLRDGLTSFWGEQLQIEPEGQGLAVAMPLMDSSGWQVVVHLAPLTPTQWLLSDQGATLGMLDDAGKHPEGKGLREVVASQGRVYGFERDGLVLQRTVRFPFDPAEIQIFAEGLAALSHLCPKRKGVVTTHAAQRIADRISRYFYDKQWTPKRHHKLAGVVETAIEVDFYWEGARPLALQPVGRTRHLRSYMEQWGWRWTDLKNAHPDLVKAMVFDPDAQQWDTDSMRIGEEVCDIFVPVYETEEALDGMLAA
ncbi:MAG: hypothetical protein KF886_14355 [Candidatus Hydrogenedentes bacterium]|nr:hypothetical protein [Candidatus Hydrogenedentota bacterium]